jgi:hypothetical protein
MFTSLPDQPLFSLIAINLFVGIADKLGTENMDDDLGKPTHTLNSCILPMQRYPSV